MTRSSSWTSFTGLPDGRTPLERRVAPGGGGKERVKIQPRESDAGLDHHPELLPHVAKLAGMTGTADTEAEEFARIYNLDVVVIPTNVPLRPGEPQRCGLQDPAGEAEARLPTRLPRCTRSADPC